MSPLVIMVLCCLHTKGMFVGLKESEKLLYLSADRSFFIHGFFSVCTHFVPWHASVIVSHMAMVSDWLCHSVYGRYRLVNWDMAGAGIGFTCQMIDICHITILWYQMVACIVYVIQSYLRTFEKTQQSRISFAAHKMGNPNMGTAAFYLLGS